MPLVATDGLSEWDAYRPTVDGVPTMNGFHLPIVQVAPSNGDFIANRDALVGDNGSLEHVVSDVWRTGRAMLSPLEHSTASSYMVQPILSQIGADSHVVGFLFAVMDWQAVLQRALYAHGFHVVLRDGCGAVQLVFGLDKSDTVIRFSDVPNDSLSEKYRYTMDIVTETQYNGQPHEPLDGVAFAEYFKDSPYGHCRVSELGWTRLCPLSCRISQNNPFRISTVLCGSLSIASFAEGAWRRMGFCHVDLDCSIGICHYLTPAGLL